MPFEPHHLAPLFDALAFAAVKHRDQKRKGRDASPYINHPIEVARVLIEEGSVSDPVVLMAAILHDTIEDTTATAQELLERFGAATAGVVQEVTDDKRLHKSERKRLQIEHAPHLSHRAKLVKLADKIANVRDMATSPPQDWPLERRQEYFEWAKRVVDGLRGASPALEAAFDDAYARKPH